MRTPVRKTSAAPRDHLDACGHDGRVHITVPDPGDGAEFHDHHGTRDRLAHRLRCRLSLKGVSIMRRVKRSRSSLRWLCSSSLHELRELTNFDRLMFITFNGPVEVPGTVLPAGTYEFKLVDPMGDPNVLEIRNEDG